jgi:hypothetical protein
VLPELAEQCLFPRLPHILWELQLRARVVLVVLVLLSE